jgi:hypothetical protein
LIEPVDDETEPDAPEHCRHRCCRYGISSSVGAEPRNQQCDQVHKEADLGQQY